MRYFMFVAVDPEAEPYDREQDTIGAWGEEMTARGVSIDGDRLRPATCDRCHHRPHPRR